MSPSSTQPKSNSTVPYADSPELKTVQDFCAPEIELINNWADTVVGLSDDPDCPSERFKRDFADHLLSAQYGSGKKTYSVIIATKGADALESTQDITGVISFTTSVEPGTESRKVTSCYVHEDTPEQDVRWKLLVASRMASGNGDKM